MNDIHIPMLLNFTCSNFRSFRDEQSFSMLPGSTKNHQSHMIAHGDTDLLSVSAIFGANASGKSNIYRAMRFSRDFILGLPIDKRSYFRLNPEYKEKPSTFEYEISVDGRLYRYGFQVVISQRRVEAEWLWRISDKESVEDELIYQRPLDADSFPLSFIRLKRRISKFLILTLADELRRNKDPRVAELLAVRRWFEKNLRIIGTQDSYVTEIDYTPEQCKELGRLLSDFDVGIYGTEFQLVKDVYFLNEDDSAIGQYVNFSEHYITKNERAMTKKESRDADYKEGRWTLLNNHGRDDEQFLWFDESDGTRRLMDLAPMIISQESDITYVVDELDRSLHPMVVYEFVRRFASNRFNGPLKQLIFTTHQTCLLDQELLRRDEVWFVQKMRDGHSELYSLDDYKERFDKNIEKMYLGGRYDAIPRITRGDL